MEFGYKIRLLRKAKGYGLREFAEKIDKSASYISNIERGIVPPPSAKVVKLIAEGLDGDVDELLQLANRFDMESIEKIRENASRLDTAERTIKFLDSAIHLEESDLLGGISGIVEIVTGERILNPNPNIVNSSFSTIRFIMDLASNPDDGYNRLGIQLRREFATSLHDLMSHVIHPYSKSNPDEKQTMDEILEGIFKKYPRKLLEEVIRRDDLKSRYLEYLKKEKE